VTLRVIGAGMPRTATKSLKTALERLLGGRCYHMEEVFEHLDHVPTWRTALRGGPVELDPVLRGYVAAVDWPASPFWRELSAANPDALVVLSVREDPERWWRSVEATILKAMRGEHPPEMDEWILMADELCRSEWGAPFGSIDAETAMAAYVRHNDEVRSTVPAGRLLEWRAADGWEPICRRLRMPVPNGPFPRVNTREEWESSGDPSRQP
jgi:Sulfotransferase domain